MMYLSHSFERTHPYVLNPLNLQELLLYLLQLVQALKFENAATDQRSSRSATNAISYDDSGLTDFLVSRGVQNPLLGNRLYWYLMVEVALEDKVISKMFGRVVFKFMNKILEVSLYRFRISLPCQEFSRLRMDLIDESYFAGKVNLSKHLPSAHANFEHRRTGLERRKSVYKLS